MNSMPLPKYSFVIPAFNESRNISNVIESIQIQSFSDFEIIVVDNASSDDTKEIISRYPKVRYFFAAQKGRSVARNEGVRHALGAFICFIDADVKLEKNWLYECDKYLGNFPVDFLATKIIPEAKDKYENIVDSYRYAFSEWKSHGMHISLRKVSGYFPVINTAACVVSKESFLQAGRFDETLNRNEDLELSLRMLHLGFFLGGNSNAESKVTFLVGTNDFKRFFVYLLRSFEVSLYSLWNRRRVNTKLLILLINKLEIKLFLYALLVEIFASAGTFASLFIKKRNMLNSTFASGKKTIFSTFVYHDKLYFLKKHILIIFVNDQAIISDPFNSIDFTLRNEHESVIWKKLISGEQLKTNEVTYIIQTNFFMARLK